MQEIIIGRPKVEWDRLTGVVRCPPEAEKIIRRLAFQADMPASEVLGQIVVQAAPYIRLVEEARGGKENDCEA